MYDFPTRFLAIIGNFPMKPSLFVYEREREISAKSWETISNLKLNLRS